VGFLPDFHINAAAPDGSAAYAIPDPGISGKFSSGRSAAKVVAAAAVLRPQSRDLVEITALERAAQVDKTNNITSTRILSASSVRNKQIQRFRERYFLYII